MITRPTAVLATLALSLGVPSAASAVSLTGAGVQIDFTDYAGQGFSPTPAPGQLDSDDWAVEGLSTGVLLFGGTAIGGDFARGLSTGGVPQGGLYAFDVSGGGVGPQIAFGWQPSGGDLTPGAFMLAVTNDTLLPLSALRIEAADITLDPADVTYLEELYRPVENLLSIGFS